MARRGGVDVEEFGIFFPPRLFKKRMKGGWDFTINALPLGGFVKLKGEHDTDTEKGSYGASSVWTKTKIMAAGVVMNLITALVLFTLLALVGIPKLLDNQFTIKSDTKIAKQKVLVTFVEKGSPAAKAGLQAQDTLLAIGPAGHLTEVKNADTLPALTQKYAGQTVQIKYARSGDVKTATTTLNDTKTVQDSRKAVEEKLQNTKLDCATIEPAKGYLGITPASYTLQRSTWSAPVTAVGLTAQMTALTFEGLGKALGGVGSAIAGLATNNNVARSNGLCNASNQVGGPVAIYFVLKDGSTIGLQYVLFIIAIISLTLAIMNILPIPALDGGRLWLTLISRAFKRPLSPRTEELVNASGFIFLMLLVILITFVDVHRRF